MCYFNRFFYFTAVFSIVNICTLSNDSAARPLAREDSKNTDQTTSSLKETHKEVRRIPSILRSNITILETVRNDSSSNFVQSYDIVGGSIEMEIRNVNNAYYECDVVDLYCNVAGQRGFEVCYSIMPTGNNVKSYEIEICWGDGFRAYKGFSFSKFTSSIVDTCVFIKVPEEYEENIGEADGQMCGITIALTAYAEEKNCTGCIQRIQPVMIRRTFPAYLDFNDCINIK